MFFTLFSFSYLSNLFSLYLAFPHIPPPSHLHSLSFPLPPLFLTPLFSPFLPSKCTVSSALVLFPLVPLLKFSPPPTFYFLLLLTYFFLFLSILVGVSCSNSNGYCLSLFSNCVPFSSILACYCPYFLLVNTPASFLSFINFNYFLLQISPSLP